jgi:dTDP-4-dehydrorhamnose reductase
LELSGVADLIPLLESKELLDAKIEEAYEAIRLKWESEKVPRCDEKTEEKEVEKEVYEQLVKPVTTLTVAEMIEALSKLPPDAKLVITESGFYSDMEFAEVMLPEPYIVGTRKTDYKPDLLDGTQVYRIGHSKQWY